jgi:DnaJ-class molecular chaperone
MEQMTDSETGETDAPICECRPCKTCGGQGETYYNTAPCAPFYRSEEVWVKCGECLGTGRNPADCIVHCGEIDWIALQIIMAPRKPAGSVTGDGYPKEAA